MFVYIAKYTDFLGNDREEECRFNLTESELVDWELTTVGGIRQLIERLSMAQDVPELTRFFKYFLEASYGVISPDGKTFDKGGDIWDKFYRSGAYNELYMKLVQDAEFAVDFIAGVIPSEEKQKGNNQNLIAMEKAKAMAQERLNNRK